ncbi:hypothetical protein CCYN2B_10032 [Capnocytophaga cynodegmi]|uniref:Uncharacterized protein n=1 Tax=Capnocytophaga cynodegmi TaxID=28189 RepID=A0A0B7H374_9FLAO|nr:hypothetical protein CCYN2B_10032 [Capnocytophaga cynodegmi]
MLNILDLGAFWFNFVGCVLLIKMIKYLKIYLICIEYSIFV